MEELVGLRIGNFTLTRRLGQGGMGVVFLAEHNLITRRKAVKVLRPESARSTALVRRFFDEAVAASACAHDHIVQIEDCGSVESDGRTYHYIEMEYLEGTDVGTACRMARSKRFDDVDRAVKIVCDAADALAAAHARGVVHRDVKPENLFLAQRGSRKDYVKLVDFGIARLTGDLAPGTRTRTGQIMGTPQYMSPEQAGGLHPDGKSDVWSLAVVLYRMLAGSVPFKDETFALLAARIQQTEAPPLSSVRRDVPVGIVRAVEAAMRKNPADRPTMAAWREMLLAADAAPRPILPELSFSAQSVAHKVALGPADRTLIDTAPAIPRKPRNR